MENLKTRVITACAVFLAVFMLNSCGNGKCDDQVLKCT